MSSEALQRSSPWQGRACLAVIAAGTVAAYGRTFSVPFLFDDIDAIANSVSIRRLWPLGPVLTGSDAVGVAGRPLLNLTYALNYAVLGPTVAGFHAVNLAIHILAAWTLFALVLRTLRSPVLADRFGSAGAPLALAVSTLWAWHPVQTESVTYLSERSESLMGLFYLLTLYGFLRGVSARDSSVRGGWFAFCVLCCLAGVGTKEVIATAPLAVLLYDRTFVSGTFTNAVRRHWPLYAALVSTWIPLGFLMRGLGQRNVGFGQGVSAWAYAMTECRVIVNYAALCVWPHPLIFDYGAYVPVRFAEAWPWALGLGSILVAGLFALWRAPVVGFALCGFLLILAPTSSFVPLAYQPMAESRLYVPLAAIVALAVLAPYARWGRASLALFACIAVCLCLATARRNRDYVSEVSLWSDTVAKNPGSYRAQNNLGLALERIPGRLDEAIAHFQTALRLFPDDAEAHNNLGNSLKAVGRVSEAISEYEQALRLKPDYAAAHNNLGNALERTPGRLNDAVAHYEAAARLLPNFAIIHYNLAVALLQLPGRRADAEAQFEAVLRLQPDNAAARQGLAKIRAGRR